MNPTPNQSKPKTNDGVREPNQVWDEAKQTVAQVADQAGEKLKSELDATKDRAAEKAGEVANALRGTREQLGDVGPLPDLASQAADQIERLAEYVQTRNLGDLVREVKGFARREPAIFLGASFAIGLLGGRLLKSSPRSDVSAVGRDPLQFEDDEYPFTREPQRFAGEDPFSSSYSAAASGGMVEPAPSPLTSSSQQTGRAAKPGGSSGLPPVPPVAERRITQPMAPLRTEPPAKPMSSSSFGTPTAPTTTSSGFGTTTPTTSPGYGTSTGPSSSRERDGKNRTS